MSDDPLSYAIDHAYGTDAQKVGIADKHTILYIAGERDFPKVLRSLLDALETWEDLGMALEINMPELTLIGMENTTYKDRMKAMLRAWLRRRGKDPSWQALCNGLRDRLVERDDIARKIEETVLEEYRKP